MNSTKRDFLRLTDLSAAEIGEIFALSAKLKAERKGTRTHLLAGRSVAIILEKASTRTRASFEVGVAQLGAHPILLGLEGSQLGRGEPIRDTARVLARYCDAIVYRTAASSRLEEMASAASIPVINALSDDGHPVQVLCDLFTIQEAFQALRDPHTLTERRIAFVGDCSSNMARSWLEAAALFGFPLTLAAPEGFLPPEHELKAAQARTQVTLCSHPHQAVKDIDVINTDVWTSMGQESEQIARREAFSGWTLNEQMLAQAPQHAIVLHCLPAHRGEEIDEETLEGPRSRVWDQAENRLHVQKGLLSWLLGLPS